MARMRAIDAAAAVMRKEGVSTVFGIPGAAINPLYSAMKKNGGFRHVLARHVEGASHMAEGYTRAKGILTNKKKDLKKLADDLLELESLSGDEINDVLKGKFKGHNNEKDHGISPVRPLIPVAGGKSE